MNTPNETYLDNDALEAELAALVETHPRLVEQRVLGTSYEGRDIPLLVLTNRQTGPDGEKPGFWIDGNIHATEVTAAMAALHIAETLVTGYGNDPQVTRVLDEQAVYIVPRLNPDGAAQALADQPRYLRSGTRPYPYEEREDGLHVEDVDGDGRILQMRIEDPTGDWKVSERDPRLMVKRGPDEEGGTYYRVLPEGTVKNYDGHIIQVARPLEGLDFNRNFPFEWRPEGQQRGAGAAPGSEPEIRAVIDFFATHPNIFGALTYHTYSRAILRPYGTKPDDEIDTNDLWVMEAIGERGTDITGYPLVSVYHHFRYHPDQVITGVFDDWLYAHKGVLAFTVELWDLPDAAGVEGKNDEKRFIEWLRKHPIEDDYRIVEFVDEHAPGGLAPWQPFDHPQLGSVEIGGWQAMYTWRNPPPSLLADELAPQPEFALAFAALAPRLQWRAVEITPLGGEDYHVRAVIENAGFLPSHGTNQAKKAGVIRPVRMELSLPEGAELVEGTPRVEVGHLEGRANKLSMSYGGSSPTDNRGTAGWLVRAPDGGQVTLTARSERAGTLRRTLALRATKDDA